jgi:hypothetical protein
MRYTIQLFFLLAIFLSSCLHGKKEIIFKKNDCYSKKLERLATDTLYLSVYSQFVDSFESLKKSEKILQFRENKIDHAIFFNKNRDKCILLILQKSSDTILFGYGRAVEGIRVNKGWQFSLSREYIFDKDYLKLFNDNSFDNISMIARYCILIDGKVEKRGCEIDDYYWFEYGK